MENRTNRPPRLTEELDGEQGGDLIDGVIANRELELSRIQDLEEPSEEIPIIPRSTNENSLEAIGPDNFRGFLESKADKS